MMSASRWRSAGWQRKKVPIDSDGESAGRSCRELSAASSWDEAYSVPQYGREYG